MIARALLVGVARYASVPSLPTAVRNDVADIAGVLRDPSIVGLHSRDLELLVDQQATAEGIRKSLRDAASSMPSDGSFLLYFSGHGERGTIDGKEASWLLPCDAELDRLATTALSSNEIVDLLDGIRAKRQVIIIDACHAGGIGAAKSPISLSPKGFGNSGIDTLSAGAGRVLLTSSRANEVSGIIRGDRNSVFTTALLEALRGATVDRGDGAVGVLDVIHYVAEQVPKRNEQHPVFHAGDLESNFALARRRAPALSLDKADIAPLMIALYPRGPTEDELWSRAGGDVSRLVLSGTGSAQWHSALTKVWRGGGGLTIDRLIATAASDFPEHLELKGLLVSARAARG